MQTILHSRPLYFVSRIARMTCVTRVYLQRVAFVSRHQEYRAWFCAYGRVVILDDKDVLDARVFRDLVDDVIEYTLELSLSHHTRCS